MADEGEAAPITTDSNIVPTIQTLNIIPQKVIQVDKPTGYYRNKEKTKIFIYWVCLY